MAQLTRQKRLTRVLYFILLLCPFLPSFIDLYYVTRPIVSIPLEKVTPHLHPLFAIAPSDTFTTTKGGLYQETGTRLAPKQFSLWQQGIDCTRLVATDTEGLEEFYRSSVSIDLYEVVDDRLVIPTIKSMAKIRHATPLKTKEFTVAYGYEANGCKILLLGKDQMIWEVTYKGEEKIEDFLPQFSKIMDEDYDFLQ